MLLARLAERLDDELRVVDGDGLHIAALRGGEALVEARGDLAVGDGGGDAGLGLARGVHLRHARDVVGVAVVAIADVEVRGVEADGVLEVDGGRIGDVDDLVVLDDVERLRIHQL